MISLPTSMTSHVGPILGAIRSIPLSPKPAKQPPPPPPVPFITVSRQPGAGAISMATQLLTALNNELPGEEPWTCWDRELVEKVAADLQLSTYVIEHLEDEDRSWLSDLFSSISFSDAPGHADDAKVYHRVAATIRRLAQTGRVVIVGRGGMFVTRQMPGGIHVRLVAPLAHRIQSLSREHHLSQEEASAKIRRIEHNRDAFYRRFWPGEILGPEAFTITLNTSTIPVSSIIAILVTLARNVAVARGNK